MKSIREIYKIGKGPSSSHTMGPERAALLFRERYPEATSFRVTLYGSLSKTGVGHGTDRVIREVLSPLPTEILFSQEILEDSHPNTLDLIAFAEGSELGRLRWKVSAAVTSASPARNSARARKCILSIPLRRSRISANGVTSIPSANMWS